MFDRTHRRPRYVLLALVGVIGCQGATMGDSEDSAHAPSPHPHPDGDWMAEVAVRTKAALHTFHPDDDGFLARNDALDYDIRVDAAGLSVQHLGDTVRPEFSAWGRDGAMRSVGTAVPEPGGCARDGDVLPEGDCARELRLDHGDGVTQWVDARARGPEQGWTLEQRPEGDGPVVIEVQIDGADVALFGDVVGLTGPSGQVYRYHGLAAWDADGEALDTWFEVDGQTIRMLVDDAGASWPIEVDPAMDNGADVTFSGSATSGLLGISVSSAGDVNNDGYDDVIVGSSGESSNRGAARIYLGGASMDATADVTISGSATGGIMGRGVAGAGDLNGDGFDDVIVGSPGEASMGAARVYFGAASMDATADLTFSGTSTGGNFGRAVSAAGDVNGDGQGDLIIGSFGESSNLGAARIYFGGSSMDTTADVTVLGAAAGAQLGRSVAQGGDLNGDGTGDVIVGSYLENSGNGAARVYFGGSSMDATADLTISGSVTGGRLGYSVARAGDVNGDGVTDLLVGSYTENSNNGAARVYYGGSGMDAVADLTISGTASGGGLGESLAYAGDVNGDGADDLLIGSYNESSGLGAARVYNGGATLDAVADVTILGAATSGLLGYSVSGAGDVNGDGVQDILVGAYNESSGLGTARIYHGSDDDADNDAVLGATDCDDANAAVGAASLRYVDGDGDGYGTSASAVVCPAVPGYASNPNDCDDTVAAIHPGAAEVCDDVDNDCDSLIDEGVTLTVYPDVDADGFGDDGAPESSCSAPSGYSTDGTDCDDLDDQVYPGQTESCDEIDNDCDGTVDGSNAVDRSTWYADLDGDFYGNAASTALSCSMPANSTADAGDCNDANATINPAGTETCDGADNDCDGTVDDGVKLTWYQDADLDGYGSSTATTTACTVPSGYTANTTDCDDGDSGIYPGAVERCDGLRNDCTDTAWGPTAEDGEVWLESSSGAWTSLTSTFSAGADGAPTSITLPASGTLNVCDGTYYVALVASASGTLSIEGVYDDAVLSAGGVGSVLRVTGSGSTVDLDRLTLEDGAGYGTPTRGGALRVSAGNVALTDCLVQDSTAASGGGLAVLGGTVTLTTSQVSGNTSTSSTASTGGGGWYQGGGTLTLTDTDVIQNTAARDGGGGYIAAGTFTASGGEISTNTAQYNGGGLRISGGATMGDTSISYNTATTGSGGGVYHVNGTLTLNTPVVQGNVAAVSGGGVYQSTGSLECVASNSASDGFFSNRAGSGGAVYLPSTATFRSTVCGFGTAAPTNNGPTDVLDGTHTYNYGNFASFYCSGGTCR